jgi:hypothetical protein
MLLDGTRNFDGGHRILGRPMRHRQHRHQRFTVLSALDGKRNDARAILATFFLSALRFVIPYIRIGDDEARLGRRNWHAARYFGSSSLLR